MYKVGVFKMSKENNELEEFKWTKYEILLAVGHGIIIILEIIILVIILYKKYINK